VPAADEVNWDATIETFVLETGDGTPLVASDRTGGELITSGVRAALAAVDHPGTVRLRVRRRPVVRVLALVGEVPGYGWAAWSLVTTPGPEPVRVGPDEASMTNGLVTVEADPSTGSFSLDGHRGLGRLVDGGDCGDTYNWCPPSDDTVVETPAAVEVTVAERGPLRARLVIRSTYLWPERCEWLDREGRPMPGTSGGSSTRRVGEVPHVVTTTLELRAGERFVRAEVTVDNRSRDHRLRLHLPLPRPADRSRAECAFAAVERGLDAEGGPTEPALPTYPAHRFVQAGGLTVVHDGVTEYELVGAGGAGSPGFPGSPASELALTLLRCTGMLSQGPMATRPLPAGPLIPTEGSQVLKTTTARLALAVGDDLDPYALADEVLVPLQVADLAADTDRRPSRGNGASTHRPAHPSPLPARGSALTIEGAEVSAVYREGGGLRARVVNTSDQPTTVTVAGRHGWLVDLRDRPLEPFDQRIELRPWGIATLAIAE
jgi:mannosylglycerate hydrolase